MESSQVAAIVTAINIENRSLGLYHAMAAKLQDVKTRRIITGLAKDGADYLVLLCALFRGSNEELVNILNHNNMYANPCYCQILKSIGGSTAEIDALRIALEEKLACIEWYGVFRETMTEPLIHNAFTRIIEHYSSQLETIKAEYLRVLIVNGLKNAPRTFIVRPEGKNFGKRIVRIART